MRLNNKFSFNDLYDTKKLVELDWYFLHYLKQHNRDIVDKLLEFRSNFTVWELKHSKLILELAPYLENFIASLFAIEHELEAAKEQYLPLQLIYECKRNFIQRKVLKEKTTYNQNIDLAAIEKYIVESSLEDFEKAFAEKVLHWHKNNEEDKLRVATEYAAWACFSKEGQKKHKGGILFKFPHKLDFNNLVPVEELEQDNIHMLKINQAYLRERKGFGLTDDGCKLNFAFDQSNYCIHCHNQGKDSCTKGLNENLKGCPLDEKISEMNSLKSKANIIGALAVAVIDNPMLAATGHRICNDCMKACIFQKQEPVNIPQIETKVLKDVLELSWGFEIYSLLTRWNPLSFNKPYPQNDTGIKILVAGMGPSGFTMAHYLLNEGHIVVGVDGLKIEPLNEKLLSEPIKNIYSFFESLDDRIIAGFGGVMEYGITNRWNKNFLLLIRLLLERRANFKLFSGVRLGSNITIKQAFALGFKHIALALGAGSPNLLNIENVLAKGVRTASDFLMSLQLGKAYKQKSLTTLQIRMPVVVIGGGLTALDAATESIAYYPLLVENFTTNFENKHLSAEEKEIASEYLAHNSLFKESASLIEALNTLGGVKILYRNKLQNSPSYRLNHEELTLGLSEGINFIENITPTKIILDQYGYVKEIEATQIINNQEKQVVIPARTILIAAGTSPNIILAQEAPEYLMQEGKYFKTSAEKFIAYNDGTNSISLLGDLHPEYAGNVVKAMASSKNAYPIISKLLNGSFGSEKSANYENFFKNLEFLLTPVLKQINRLSDNIVELLIQSPLSAQNFRPGQFFRLQNYMNAELPLMEGLALTGAKVENDTISTIILEMGNSSKLCAQLKVNEPIVLMGPTGAPTEITANENIMLVGGGLGNAVLFSIGQAFRKQNSNVIYFAGYKKLADRYKVEEIERAADQIIWACDEGILQTTRKQDKSFHCNIIEAIQNFAKENNAELSKIDRIIVIGSDKMMHAFQKARSGILKPYLKPNHQAVASVNSPMQCMMKEICGQCLQKHVDPITGLETYVFSCTNQDQDMDRVDFNHLSDRLAQNHLLEHLSVKS